MAHRSTSSAPQASNRVPYDPRKLANGSPKKAPHHPRPMKSNITKMSNGTRTGDAVSDDSDNEAQEGAADSPDEESDSDDEADVFALSGAKRNGNIAAPRLAGPAYNVGADAVAGAEKNLDSEDEDYDAVDDDDEEEDDMEKALEKDLIQDFLEHEAETEAQRPQTATSVSNDMTGLSLAEDASLARRLSLQSEDDLNWTEDPFHGLRTDDTLYQEMIDDAEDEFSYNLASWRMQQDEVSEDVLFDLHVQRSNNEKRVRFAENRSSRSSSMSSEDDPRDSYPDLLDGTSTPRNAAQYMMDVDAIDDDNESHFDFDYEDDYEGAIAEGDDEEDSDLDSDTSDETDGDATDDEDEEDAFRRMHAIHRENAAAAAESTPASTPIPSTPSTPVTDQAPPLRQPTSTGPRPRGGKPSGRPRMGTFTHDPTRAAVTADENGNGIKISCPSKPIDKESAYWEQARQVMGSRDGSPGEPVTWTRTTPHTASIPQRPFTAKMTLGSMFNGNLDFLRTNDVNGITNGLVLPSTRGSSARSSFASSNTLDRERVTPAPAGNLEDLVQYPDTDSDMDVDPTPSAASQQQDVFASFTNDDSEPMPRLDNEDLLDHFDQVPGGISVFRNNQHNVRQVSSLAANPASRVQTSEANALQKGRRNAANIPITPGRKTRPSVDMTLTGAGVRKSAAHASPLAQKRRRSRGNSLSQTLALDRFGSKA
ncbi:hypothetical protein CB0940_06664 [Cercospora beticola]|uniref:Uncharacterized protein n=2 Tax=Cercospora beticola TaxID=122368 RepID=A0A2G5I0R9_CERBT|nr:hypothetical protein CB0940_06664 [Cercospora beticola]PIA98384.1 hypothetical protein CB0940_06664 [Cercospora beticola]CAK1360652.1 unnamed protein product [Cercospora beticola]